MSNDSNKKGDRIATANCWVGKKLFKRGQVIRGLSAKELESIEKSTAPIPKKKKK